MKTLLLVFIGGGTGSVARFLISKAIPASAGFPLATFLVNFSGCLFIGIISGLVAKQLVSQQFALIFATGFCGGFTTFSAFAYENQALIKSGDYLNFALYTFASIFLGIAAVFLGLFLSGMFKN